MKKKLCLLSVIFILLSGILPQTVLAKTSLFAYENFDQYVSAGVPNAVGFSGAQGDGAIEASPSHENWGNCMRIYSADGISPFVNIRLGGIPQKVSVTFNMMFAGAEGERNIYLRDGSNKLFLLMNTKENYIYVLGQKAAEFKKIEFYNLTFDLNLSDKTCVFYLNDEKMSEGKLDENMSKKLIGLKLVQKADGSGSSMFVDNFAVFTGEKPKTPEKSLPDITAPNVEKVLSDSVAFFNASDDAIFFGERRQINENSSVVPKMSEGVAQVPLGALASAFGGTVEIVNDEITVLFKKKTVSLKNGSDVLLKDGQKISMSNKTVIENGEIFVSAKQLCEALGLSCFLDPHGLILISEKDKSESLNSNQMLLDEVIKTVCYERPSRDDILSDFLNAGMMDTHPSLMIGSDGFDKIKKNIETNEEFKRWFEKVKSSTEQILEMKPIVHSRSDGRRLDDAQKMYTTYLPPLLIMYNLTGETKYAEAAWGHMEALCNFPEWGDASAEHLNVAELSSAMALGYDWLYHYLTPAQRELCKNAIINKGVKVGIKFHEENQWWITSPWNWNMSMAGGLSLAGMIMLADEPFLSSQLISNALKSAEASLSSFYPDGSWDEGMSYWKYTIMNLCAMISSADVVLNNDYGIFNAPGLSQTPYMPLHYTGPVGVFNFHDTGTEEHAPELAYFAKKFNNPGIMYQLYNSIQKETPRFRDLLWFDPEFMDASGSDIPLDNYYQKVETMFMHQNWSNTAIYTGLHAGDNTVGHAHMDSGNFIIDANGERWIIDPGKDQLAYRLPSWDQRFIVWALRTEAHNCIVINPDDTPGQIEKSNSPIIEHASKPKGAYAIADLTSAYSQDIKKYHRGLMFTDNRRAVVVRDEITSSKANDIRWSVSTKANVEVSEDGRSALLTQGGKNFYVVITEGEGKFEVKDAGPLETSPNPDGQTAFNGLKQLEIWRKGVSNMVLSVAFIPLNGNQTEPERIPEAIPLSGWKNSLPDGEIVSPELSDIKINGETIQGFDKSVKDYIIRLSADDEIPEVMVAGENVDVEVIYSGDYIVTANISVISKLDRTMTDTYQVAFYREAKQIALDPANKLKIKGIKVSAEPQAQNAAANAIDGNRSTRWSAEYEQWLELELEEISDISAINLSTYLGSERSQYFDLDISEDGINYTTVYTGATSGMTDDMEAIPFDTIRGKYVKLRCHGTDTGSWNSICEIEVYK